MRPLLFLSAKFKQTMHMRTTPIFLTVASILIFGPGIHAGFAEEAGLYFPPANGNWETVKPGDVGWDRDKIQQALDYAGKNQSSGVVILYRGRILAEQFWSVKGARSAKYRKRILGRDKAGHA